MNKLRKLANDALALRHRLQLRRDQWKDSRQLEKSRSKRIRAIIKHAYNYVPYYHRLFLSAGIKPEDIKNSGDLRKIPSTSKRDVQENYPDIIARGLDVSKLTQHFTSGSTGVPLKVISDNLQVSFHFGSATYSFSECGVKSNDNFVTLVGGVQSMIGLRGYVRLLGGIGETIVPLVPQEKLINVLRGINPSVIYAFPSVFSSLANYDVSGINPRLIFTQGEILTPHCRDLVRNMFNLELLDTYGSVEFGILAFECNEHCGSHMITSGAHIEFVDEDGEEVSPSEQGEIIVTGFYNHAMPLIRYRIGDEGVPTNEKCTCGRSWPLIKSISGRIGDHLVLPSGRKITLVSFFHSFKKELEKNVFCISQYQIIQEEKNRIIFRVVKGKEFDPHVLERIKKCLENHFAKREGEKLEVVMQVVKEIPAERTGKRRMWISLVDESDSEYHVNDETRPLLKLMSQDSR